MGSLFRLDESKLRILELLGNPMTTTELARVMNLSKATVSHHLKILSQLRLVKVVRTETENNFVKKYYLSTLSSPDMVLPHEEEVLKDFPPSKENYMRSILKMLVLLNLENKLLLKKIGFDLGYHLLSKKIEEGRNGKIHEEIADLWEHMKLGNVVEATPQTIAVEECYLCKGLPNIGEPYCRIEEGVIEGILAEKTGKHPTVREVKCWGTGDQVCLFTIKND